MLAKMLSYVLWDTNVGKEVMIAFSSSLIGKVDGTVPNFLKCLSKP